ncbi:MAG: hypothetical protein ABJE95_38535 [Byssovorax sp.]
MNQVQRPADGGQVDVSIRKTMSLCWSDPREARQWLFALREQTLDAIATGEDATRAPRRRIFSRHEARRRIREAEGAIARLFAAAERGLGESEVPSKTT